MKAEHLSESSMATVAAVIVDDDPDAAESLAMLLESRGVHSSVALTGQAAVTMVRDQAPIVVVCDLEMPGMNGLETALCLRALPGGGALRLIALTGRDNLEGAARQAGFDAYFVKPAGAQDVADLVGELCTLRH